MIEKIKRFFKTRIRQFPLFRKNKNPNPIKWGIIGLGNMAEVFAMAIGGNKDGVVYAVSSRDIKKAETFGKRHSCSRTYGSYDEMLNDNSLELDIVYIAVPVKYHYEIIKQCLLAGKNVLCEKPITFISSELEKLITLAKENDCFLMEGMWMKCLPTFQKSKEWIKNGKIGKQELVKVDFYKREWIRPELSIHNPSEGGGVLRDFGVYAISFAISFLEGIPDRLSMNNRISTLNLDTDWQICFEKDNLKAFISISSNFASLSKAVVSGSEGTIEWNSQFNRANTITLFDKFGIKKDRFFVKYDYEGFEYEVNEVHNCLRAGLKESSIVPLAESLETLKVIDYIFSTKL